MQVCLDPRANWKFAFEKRHIPEESRTENPPLVGLTGSPFALAAGRKGTQFPETLVHLS